MSSHSLIDWNEDSHDDQSQLSNEPSSVSICQNGFEWGTFVIWFVPSPCQFLPLLILPLRVETRYDRRQWAVLGSALAAGSGNNWQGPGIKYMTKVPHRRGFLYRYPMDRQLCSIIFQSSAYTNREVKYQWKNRTKLPFIHGLAHQDEMTPEIKVVGYR